MTRELLKTYGPQGNTRDNVTKITNEETGSVSYLTQSIPFGEEADRVGASIVDTYETETKHVLLFFNNNNSVVGKYYMGKKLQGLTPTELVEKKPTLCIFESFNPETKAWVPCVGLATNQGPSNKAAHL